MDGLMIIRILINMSLQRGTGRLQSLLGQRKSNKRPERFISYLFSRGGVVELIIIKKYLHEFHDGALLAIERKGQDYVLSLESAEMDRSDIKDGLPLSERGTIKGKLHLKSVQSIKINESKLQDELKMQYDYGSIFDFDIQ